MKINLLVMFLLISVTTIALEPGLSDQDKHFIQEFRLPDWGYKGFDIQLSGSGNNKGYDIDNYNRVEQYSVYFNPAFYQRKESENDITETEFDFNSRYYYYRNSEYHSGKYILRNIDVEPSFVYTKKTYNSEPNYVNLETALNYHYDFINNDYSNNWFSDDEINDRMLSFSILGGFGTGKIRDVTPVIRALRFKQRFNSLGKGNLTDQKISRIAETMASYPGYNFVYDRSEKTFWNTVFNSLGDKTVGLSGYETFFITEAMQEEIGTRLEGKELDINFQYSWSEINRNGKLFDETIAFIGPVLQTKMYSNISIGHQVGMELYATVFFPTSVIKPFENILLAKFNHSQLITITDRVLYTFNGIFSAQKEKYKYGDNSGIALEIFNDFSYYFENNFSLTFYINYLYQKFEHASFSDDIYYYNPSFYDGLYKEFGEWNFGISLNYRLRSM